MSTQSRVQSGVPTGGQFAADRRSEADIQLQDVRVRAGEMTDEAELRTAQMVAKLVLERFPDAAWLDLETSDQSDSSMWADSVLDANGEVLSTDDQAGDEEFADELNEYTFALPESGAWRKFNNDNDTREFRGRKYGRFSMDVRAAAAQTFQPAGQQDAVPGGDALTGTYAASLAAQREQLTADQAAASRAEDRAQSRAAKLAAATILSEYPNAATMVLHMRDDWTFAATDLRDQGDEQIAVEDDIFAEPEVLNKVSNTLLCHLSHDGAWTEFTSENEYGEVLLDLRKMADTQIQ